VRVVLDTNVVIAALRSGAGASSETVKLARWGRITLVGTLPLALEYEEVALRPEHVAASGLTPMEAAAFVKGIVALLDGGPTNWRYRPFLRDMDDEMVLEAAISRRAAAIVTFNKIDFVGAERFGIETLWPAELIGRLC
jgi:predicted nucleic acid-binding protein